ncbi:MAG: autotransporter outer membrane beta-barrel domain-containing protein [Bacteroidota bacterium]|nr:autotransporter outer membrane beta-barrel domain-containing protein [Bacteroidota bacterium]
MFLKKHLLALCLLIGSIKICNAQIEVAHVTSKNFTSTGFGGFLNFAIPVAEVNYVTLEGGFQYFKNKYDEDLAFIPVLIGYRYTLNQTGSGFYVEPYAGYTFGASSIGKYDENGGYLGGDEKVEGPTAGVGAGYLIDLGNIPFNFGLRYQHNFGNYATNVFSFRISHTFHIGRRSDD